MPTLALGSGYEFEGIGVKEVSRAGAAIANSDDWSAVYWNPANIAHAAQSKKGQVGLEVFGGAAYERDPNSLSKSDLGAIFTKDKISAPYYLGALGAAIPVGKRAGIGVGVYTPILQGVDFSDTSTLLPVTLDFKSSLGIVTGSVVGSVNIHPQVSVGAGVNILYGSLKTKTDITMGPSVTSINESGSGVAPEGIVGVRYDIHPKVSVGAVYRTGADVHISGDVTADVTSLPRQSSTFKYNLRHPPTTGVGISYRPDDKISYNLDCTQTYWRRFSSNMTFSPEIPGLLVSKPNTFDWKDTWKLRFGSEYKLTDKTDLMGGYSFDHPGLDAASVDISTSIEVPLHRFYLGGGHRWNERWESILGGIYAYGTRKEGDIRYRLSGWQLAYETRIYF